jgi:dipeptidyl aminopeptidase/acylaminoacyl peptidase
VEAAQWTVSGLFLITDGGDDFLGVAEVDVALPAQVKRWVLRDDHDVLAFVPAPGASRAAVVINAGIYDRILILERERNTVQLADFPPGVVIADHTGDAGHHVCWSSDGGALFAAWDSPTRPADIVAHPGQARWTKVNGAAAPALVSPSELTYPSFDGLLIPSMEYRIDDRPRPTVCLFHGGPEGQWRGGYAPLHHLLNAIGVNTFCPNVRGSNGYGFRFQSLDDKTLRWNSVKDGVAAGRWLRRTGRATRVAAMGGSYGGFMTLAVLVEAPDLWDAAVETVGIARWRTFFERMPPWRGTLRVREYGDPYGPEAEFLESISPLNRAGEIGAPLLVVHGRNDPRVPVAESEAIAAAAPDAELLIFEDEGHGIARLENQARYHRRILEFLETRLQPMR